ncbi:glycerate kinase [bacterium]|nr:glycerate kinase [bacterium]
MKIVIAPDSFKGSLTALQVSDAVEEGFKRIFPNAQIEKVPMADGGEGTVQSLVDATGGQLLSESVTDPLGGKVEANYGILGDGVTAVIEMAAASGLPLVPIGKRNPMLTTTYGTGELVKAALERGCRKFIIGIGGSATTDGGAGVAQALGVRLLDASGKDIAFGGIGLSNLTKIDMSTIDEQIAETETVVACDVDNPLTGPRGAARVYGPQKGATPEQVELLDQYLEDFAGIVKRDLGKDVKETPGAGAAGGLGAGLMAFLNAELKSGIDIVIEASNLRERMSGGDLVVTGEGQLDEQTAYGKTPTGVSRVAEEMGIPVLAIAGGIKPGAETSYNEGIDAMMSIAPGPISLEEAIARSSELVADTAEQAARIIKIGFDL